jgi:hypothetical protein
LGILVVLSLCAHARALKLTRSEKIPKRWPGAIEKGFERKGEEKEGEEEEEEEEGETSLEVGGTDDLRPLKKRTTTTSPKIAGR